MVAALIVRDVPRRVYAHNAILPARRRTRCCDAQCAGAIVFAKCHHSPPVVVAALIVTCLCYVYRINAIILVPPVVVPVVVMLSAPVPCFRNNAIFPARRGGRVNREDVPAESYSH